MLFCSDVTGGSHDLESCSQHVEGDTSFVSLRTPYCGMIVLDDVLAAEMISSPMLDFEESIAVFPLESKLSRERAAAGLCWCNIPSGLPCRFVIPVSRKTRIPLSVAWVEHLPANYTNVNLSDATTHWPWGRTATDNMFGS
jgi:hypothetical protein